MKMTFNVITCATFLVNVVSGYFRFHVHIVYFVSNVLIPLINEYISMCALILIWSGALKPRNTVVMLFVLLVGIIVYSTPFLLLILHLIIYIVALCLPTSILVVIFLTVRTRSNIFRNRLWIRRLRTCFYRKWCCLHWRRMNSKKTKIICLVYMYILLRETKE